MKEIQINIKTPVTLAALYTLIPESCPDSVSTAHTQVGNTLGK